MKKHKNLLLRKKDYTYSIPFYLNIDISFQQVISFGNMDKISPKTTYSYPCLMEKKLVNSTITRNTKTFKIIIHVKHSFILNIPFLSTNF